MIQSAVFHFPVYNLFFTPFLLMYSAQQLSTLTPLYNIRHDSSHISLTFCVCCPSVCFYLCISVSVLITNMDF